MLFLLAALPMHGAIPSRWRRMCLSSRTRARCPGTVGPLVTGGESSAKSHVCRTGAYVAIFPQSPAKASAKPALDSIAEDLSVLHFVKRLARRESFRARRSTIMLVLA